MRKHNPSRGRFALLALVVLLMGLSTVVPPAAAQTPAQGGSTTTINGVPGLLSSYIVGDGTVLIFVGAESWTAQWSSVGNNSQVYSNQLILIAFDLVTTEVHLTLDAYQNGHGWVENQSVPIPPQTEVVITVTFVQDTSWTGVTLLMDGTPFKCQIATPFTLLPPNVANVGGLDLLTLGIISEAVICFSGFVALSRVLMKRAKWAPKFSLLIWGHVVLIGIASAVILNYEWVNQTFAGWSPLVYVFAVSPMFFLFSLSLFNSTEKLELLQPLARPNAEMVYRRWLLRTAILSTGERVLIWETWRGWLARLFGHHVVIERGDEKETKKFEARILEMKSPTRTQSYYRATDRFKVINPQSDEVKKLCFTDTGDPVFVRWPRLTMHREVEVPAKVNEAGTVVLAAHTKRVLTWPHYTEPQVRLDLALEHFKAAAMVGAHWANLRALGRVLSKTKTDLYALKANYSEQVEAETESRLTSYYSLIGRTSADLTDEEAKNEAQKGTVAPSLAELLDEERLRARGKKPPTGEGT